MSRNRGGIDTGLEQLLTRLWSVGGAGGTTLVLGRSAPPRHRLLDAFVAVPSATHPRFLVPRAERRAMATTLTSYIALRHPRTRMLRRGLAVAARTGALGRVVGAPIAIWAPGTLDDHTAGRDTFAAHLRHALDEPTALVAMGVPHMDAHYKPTAQLFSATGVPLGFAKLGWTAPTAELVRREADALRRWQSGSLRLRVPALLRTGTWDGLPYLVTEPLPAHVRAVDDRDPLPRVAWDIAGDVSETLLHDSPWWASVRRRLDALPSRVTLPGALRHAAAVLDEVCGAERWAFGRWHGDWASWNVARTDAAVHAWDWEHSTSCAPWGFDLLHWQVTVPQLRHGVPHSDSVSAVARSALLPGVAVPRRTLLLAYLLEIGLRMMQLHRTPVDLLGPKAPAHGSRPAAPVHRACRGTGTRDVAPEAKLFGVLARELHELAVVPVAGKAR